MPDFNKKPRALLVFYTLNSDIFKSSFAVHVQLAAT